MKPCTKYRMKSQHDIVFENSDLEDGGAQRVVSRLVRHWVERGLGVAVVTLSRPETDFFGLPGGATRIVAGGIGSFGGAPASVVRNIWRLFLLRGALKKANAKVVIPFVGRTVVQTLLANCGLGSPVIACERNDPSAQSLGWAWDKLRRFTYPRATVVTANSTGALEYMASFVPTDRLRIVRNPVKQVDMSGASDRLPVFLVVGRLVRQKGHEHILRAFASVASRLEGWQLWILGQGDLEEQLRRSCADLGIADRVVWHGLVSDPGSYYRRASVFVSASAYEGMPNAMLEAMTSCLPVVVSDASPGPLEIVENGQSGLVYSLASPEGLAKAMASIADDPGLRDRLGEAGRLAVRQFSEDRVFEEWDRLVDEVVAR